MLRHGRAGQQRDGARIHPLPLLLSVYQYYQAVPHSLTSAGSAGRVTSQSPLRRSLAPAKKSVTSPHHPPLSSFLTTTPFSRFPAHTYQGTKVLYHGAPTFSAGDHSKPQGTHLAEHARLASTPVEYTISLFATFADTRTTHRPRCGGRCCGPEPRCRPQQELVQHDSCHNAQTDTAEPLQ